MGNNNTTVFYGLYCERSSPNYSGLTLSQIIIIIIIIIILLIPLDDGIEIYTVTTTSNSNSILIRCTNELKIKNKSHFYLE